MLVPKSLVTADILIVGDSFASCRHQETDWPVALVTKLTGTMLSKPNIPRGRGFNGAAWWSTRNLLLQELKISVPKILVICHTEETRIPSDDGLGLNSSSIYAGSVCKNDETDGRGADSAIVNAAALYLKYLYSYKFNKWAQYAWYRELDNLIETLHIPIIIHLHCFESMGSSKTPVYQFKNGMVSEEILCNLSFTHNDFSDARLRNHFSAEQNLAIANAIYIAITANYESGVTKNLNLLGTA
jgi:hypothetical protein